MKKTLLLLALAGFFAACSKKSNDIQPKAKLYPVTFSTSDFTSTVKKLGAKTSAVDSSKNYLLELWYVVYNSSGALFKIDAANRSTPNFGTFKDSLPSGNYTVVFAGAADGGVDIGQSQELSNAHLLPFGTPDAFFKKINITVGSESLHQQVTLDRISGRLTLKLLDDNIPSNVGNVQLKIPVARRFGFTNGLINEELTAFGMSPAFEKSRSYNFFATNKMFDLELIVYRKGSISDTLFTRKVKGITVYTNRETIVQGKLFVNGSSFDISVDKDWGIPETVQF